MFQLLICFDFLICLICNYRQTVSSILRTLDPDGVARRRHRVIDRRSYVNKGPNYLIHIDGYDKLKRYGFPIHGAIDGYLNMHFYKI